jgi:dTDP-4-amino-4,6-dideoxygalactose transaminase
VGIDRALALARRHRLRVIEDCAHALGATYDGRQVGSFGNAAFFGTEEKTISSGMGGVVVTDDPVLAEWMEAFQASCARPSAVLAARCLLKVMVFSPDHRAGRPPPYAAAVQAPEVPDRRAWRDQRPKGARRAARPLRAALEQCAGGHRLEPAPPAGRQPRAPGGERQPYTTRLDALGFDVPRPPAKARPAFARYPLCVSDKARVMRAVAPYAVLGQWLNEPVDGAIPPGGEDDRPESCPCAESSVAHLVNLPTHLKVRMHDAERIIACVAASMQLCDK